MINSEKEKLLELIDNQIAYWNKLKSECIEPSIEISKGNYKKPCSHEPDTKKHLFSDEGGNFFMNRCKHCREFYK